MENPISASLQKEALNQPSASNPSRTQKPLMYKNRLQQYAQRSSMQLPVYQTVYAGSLHPPRFRSTVFVDGTSYTSVNTFSNRKAAEQDVAKLALESIVQKIKDEGCPLICEDTVFCKSILNEFAAKMSLDMPIYNTTQSKGVIFLFQSSLIFNGVTYKGKTARTKKEAEQLAARAALLSILDDSRYGIFLSEIFKSKAKLYGTALDKVKDSNDFYLATTPAGANTLIHENKEVETAVVIDNVPTSAVLQPSSEANHPRNELVHRNEELEAAAVIDNVPTSAVLQTSSEANHPRNELVLKSDGVETAAAIDNVPTSAVLQPSSEANHPRNELVHKSEEVETAALSDSVPTSVTLSSGVKPHHELIETAAITDSVPTTAILEPSTGAKHPHHEFKIPKSEPHSECIDLPITFVPSALEQSSGVGESSSRKRRKKKRAKLHIATRLAVAAIPLNQATPCSTVL